MFILEMANLNPSAIATKTVEQIVAMCGDGKLRDGSDCCREFRAFLAAQPNERIAGYARYCLDSKFESSGYVLQDCVNEIGRRLGYSVTDGRYAGIRNANGFDGLWSDSRTSILIEVKTTDAYRINLDVVTGYAERLISDGSAKSGALSTLVVVGRQDTGDLEAQVRGSRHAWSVRLISVDALTKLMFVREGVDTPGVIEKVRRILAPFEYTRVDNIVELVFEAQQETEGKLAAQVDIEDDPRDIAAEFADPSKGSFEFTPRNELEAKRRAIVDAFFAPKNETAIKKTVATFEGNGTRAVCAVSKRYKRDYQPYWYALHPQWVDYLRGGRDGYFILGCMDRSEAYAIPISRLEPLLPELNRTELPNRHYWHVNLGWDDQSLVINLTKVGKKIDLREFSFPVEK